MAKKLDELPPAKFGGQKYPWDEWLDGDPWLLVQGEDYNCKTVSMASAAREYASRQGGKVVTRMPEGQEGDRIIIMYVEDDS